MAQRTTYSALDFNEGELKAINLATDAAHGITQDDLEEAEANALQLVNQFVIKVAGPTLGAAIVEEFADDANPLDPLIPQMAELIASAEVLEKWERFNRSDEGPDGQVRRSDPDTVRGRATKIAQDIVNAGGTLKSTGVFRRWRYAKGQQGPRVSGPLSRGSYFDPTGYTDPWGRRFPGPPDPYGVAHNF